MADNQTNSSTQPQNSSQASQDFSKMDPVILAYIASIVFYKHGGQQTDVKDSDKEVYVLYNKFQEGVFNLAYSQLLPEKQQELNQIVTEGASQEQIQKFVLNEIPDFQTQLEKYFKTFQKEYLGELSDELESISAELESSAQTSQTP